MYILNKEQRGYVTPAEFNSLATLVQDEIFESYFPDFYSDFFIAHQLILGLWIIPSSLSLAIYPTLANTKILSTTQFINKTLPYIFAISIVFFSVVYLFLINLLCLFNKPLQFIYMNFPIIFVFKFIKIPPSISTLATSPVSSGFGSK